MPQARTHHSPPAVADAADEALVLLVLTDGSEQAFRALYRRHTPQLYRIALRMLSSEADAEDAVQEAWLRGMAKLKDFAWRSALGTWLTSITVNVARDVLDRRGRWVNVEIDDDAPWMEAAPVQVPVDLERAVAALPPGCRTVFILHDVEGFTHDEIGQQLGVSAGTSKSQVFRARRMLRRLLGGAEAEVEEKTHGT